MTDTLFPIDQAAGLPETSVEAAFIEQAEYIPEQEFLAWSAEHPDEERIIRSLSHGGAKLLVGPRGCGKTTLMLKSYYRMLREEGGSAFPLYTNFKLSLKLEPLYINTPNATFWFQKWLIAKIYDSIFKSLGELENVPADLALPDRQEVQRTIDALEAGRTELEISAVYTTEYLSDRIRYLLHVLRRPRCVLLLDDAAHAFSPKQQEDFFEFFRQIKSKEISPKAAIYPGITTFSPTFHVGHDAEQIDAWIRPDSAQYVSFMRSLAAKRFGGDLPPVLRSDFDSLDFLAYAAFGIPRSFLNMIRSIFQDDANTTAGSTIDRRKLLTAAKQSRESAHNVYESLEFKLPAYSTFIHSGEGIYARLLTSIKDFNRDRSETNQAVEVAIKRPIPFELSKLLSFYQYAGLLMPSGENSRGIKGVFDIYMVHFGDLITENALIGRRTKSVPSFVAAFKAQTHQAWPRISPERLAPTEKYAQLFRLSLPHCQRCGTVRASQDARFCTNCGAQLKTSSVYEQLVGQDISALPITRARAATIKQNSSIRTINDILIDTSHQELRSVPYVGPIWAERIAHYAEEHVA